jgi:hypothetical protein
LTGLQHGFGGLLAVDESAVGGIEVSAPRTSAPRKTNLAMMAGNGRFSDLKSIVLHPAHGGFIHLQLMRTARLALAKDYEFGHSRLA